MAEEPHPLDVKYGLLRAKLESLGPKDEEFQMIQKYVECTGSPVEKKNLQNVWRVDREGEVSEKGDRLVVDRLLSPVPPPVCRETASPSTLTWTTASCFGMEPMLLWWQPF